VVLSVLSPAPSGTESFGGIALGERGLDIRSAFGYIYQKPQTALHSYSSIDG